MQTQQLSSDDGVRTYALILETGDEVLACVRAFAEREQLTAAHFSGIGAFSDAVLGYFQWETKAYRENGVTEQVEVATLNGDVAVDADGKPAVHIHVVLGRRDGTALAGHLMSGRVRPTLEIVLTETPAHLRKRLDPESGLTLIRPEG